MKSTNNPEKDPLTDPFLRSLRLQDLFPKDRLRLFSGILQAMTDIITSEGPQPQSTLIDRISSELDVSKFAVAATFNTELYGNQLILQGMPPQVDVRQS